MDLRSKLLAAKRKVLLHPNVLPPLRLVLEIEALPLAERLSRLDEVGTAIKSELQKISQISQISEGVLFVITWFDELTPALVTEETIGSIHNFSDVLLSSIGPSSSLPEINVLRR